MSVQELILIAQKYEIRNFLGNTYYTYVSVYNNNSDEKIFEKLVLCASRAELYS